MAIDWVKPLKVEPEQDMGWPTEMDPSEDGLFGAGIAFTGSDVYIIRENDDMTFYDPETGSVTLSELNAAGTSLLNTITTASTHTVTGYTDALFCNPTTDFTVTLPTAQDGYRIYIKNKRTVLPKQEVTIEGALTATIDNQTSIGIRNSESVVLISDGTDWWVN